MPGDRKTRTIRVRHLARVEGEGGLTVRLEDGKLAGVELRIFEPPRFFEALLRGRHFSEAPDIAARICGICPVAYQMSAVHAIERACGVEVGGMLRELRRLIYGAEWVESHALHVTLLHAPDFLGYDDAARMAKDHPELVERGLRIKKAGNALLRLLGGREIHPVNVRVGGFYRVPSRGELSAQRQALERARDDAAAMARWAMGLPFPDFERDYEFVALAHPAEYPFNEGRIASSAGLDIDAADFDAEFEERQEPRSTALHCRLRARGAYLVGPMARYRLNRERLSPLAKDLARAAGLGPVCRNPFRSIVVRAVEIVHALEEALRLIAAYEPPDAPFVEVAPRAGVGCAATEAPRGILYHAYRLDEAGRILEARIVPPTSQNQTTIEDDLRALLPAVLSEPPETIERRSEQAVRNHDPCISCAAHFLKLEIEGR